MGTFTIKYFNETFCFFILIKYFYRAAMTKKWLFYVSLQEKEGTNWTGIIN